MFEQIKLDYDFNALEPYIDAQTMEVHYGKHHATYTANLNKLADEAGLSGKSIEDILADAAVSQGIKNNGGGFYNHNLYFMQIAPGGSNVPVGSLAAKIDETFGSFETLKEKLTALAIGQFGSGWAWLSKDGSGKLYVSNSANQDNPISLQTGQTPILAIDVWEHAYYLKYKNLRASYVDNLWNVINWNVVGKLYEEK